MSKLPPPTKALGWLGGWVAGWLGGRVGARHVVWLGVGGGLEGFTYSSASPYVVLLVSHVIDVIMSGFYVSSSRKIEYKTGLILYLF